MDYHYSFFSDEIYTLVTLNAINESMYNVYNLISNVFLNIFFFYISMQIASFAGQFFYFVRFIVLCQRMELLHADHVFIISKRYKRRYVHLIFFVCSFKAYRFQFIHKREC